MNILNTGLNAFVDNGNDMSLVKSLNKSNLVQVQRTVKGKYGTYTRMQWVKASEVKSTDTVVKNSGYPMMESEAEERNKLHDAKSKARLHSYKYKKGTVVEFKSKENLHGKEVITTKIGVVKSALFSYSSRRKFTDIDEISSTSIQIETMDGKHYSLNTMNDNCKISVVSKSKAESVLKRKLFPHQYFPLDGGEPLTEQEVLEAYDSAFDSRITFDQFVRNNYFDSDGHNSTQSQYKVDGKYTPERTALHDTIIDEIVSKASLPPAGQKPIAYLFGGGSASGKSSVVSREVNKTSEQYGINFGTVDSDEIKKSIPEYEHFIKQNVEKAAARVHDESSDIANKAIDRLIESGRCFSFDGTMKNFEKYSAIVDKLKDAGYEVRIASADIPLKEAIARSDARAKKTGRKVPHGIIAGSHGGFALTYPKLISKVDRFCLFDNSQPEGQEPTLVMDQDGIHNQELWDRFIEKGEEYARCKNKQSRGNKHGK